MMVLLKDTLVDANIFVIDVPVASCGRSSHMTAKVR